MASDASAWRTAISQVSEDDVLVRGYSLSELIPEVSFTDAAFLVATGDLPTVSQRRMLDAIMVSLIEHGISPSSMITRILVSCGTPVQGAVAGGVLSVADWHGGAGEQVALLLSELAVDTAAEPKRAEAIVNSVVDDYRRHGLKVPGFGHPQHSDGDPRAVILFDVASKLDVLGIHTELLRSLQKHLERATGKSLKPNVNGAIASILLDLGFAARAVRGIVITSRAFGLVAHAVEELDQQHVWRHIDADDVEYIGHIRRSITDRPLI